MLKITFPQMYGYLGDLFERVCWIFRRFCPIWKAAARHAPIRCCICSHARATKIILS